jgi:hypothetical protein
MRRGVKPPAIFGGYKIRWFRATNGEKKEFFWSLIVTLISFIVAGIASVIAVAFLQK